MLELISVMIKEKICVIKPGNEIPIMFTLIDLKGKLKENIMFVTKAKALTLNASLKWKIFGGCIATLLALEARWLKLYTIRNEEQLEIQETRPH